MTNGSQPTSQPPLRWVSRAERAWDDDAVWKACVDLLEKEPIESLSPEQRVAYFALHADRELRSGSRAALVANRSMQFVRETVQALERIGALPQARWLESKLEMQSRYVELTPTVESCLRAYVETYEPYFVREARPNCTS